MTTPASTTAGARDGTAAPPPALATPLIEVSTLTLRVHNRRVAAAPCPRHRNHQRSEQNGNGMRRGLPLLSTPVHQRVLAGAFPLVLCVQRCLVGSP